MGVGYSRKIEKEFKNYKKFNLKYVFSPQIIRLFHRLPFSFEPCKNMDGEAR